MHKVFAFVGSILALLGVGLGALGTHGLALSSYQRAIYDTAAHYHQYHALGLITISCLSQWLPNSRWIRWSGYLLILGTIVFSGSLYLLAVTGIRGLGMITPFGGLSLLLGWGMLARGILAKPGPKT
jgi:uncharacterized membrane protein YgdD (TMEM256/DUF423 family)